MRPPPQFIRLYPSNSTAWVIMPHHCYTVAGPASFNTRTLKNGVRVLRYLSKTPVCNLCIMVGTGSASELPSEYGVAHLCEHMMFKGTPTRNPTKILSSLDSVGGELNAYTTKTETVIYATFLKEHFWRAVELICDMFFNSTFPQAELDKEREVVISEIMQYRDTPSDRICDDFESAVLPPEEGHNIFGTPESLTSLTSDSLRTFRQRTYKLNQIVVGVAGDVPCAAVDRAAERILELVTEFGGATAETSNTVAASPTTCFRREVNMGYNQSNVVIGMRWPGFTDRRKDVLRLLVSVLGGPQMNSRLNVALRERNGIGYTSFAEYAMYRNCGLFYVYFDADPRSVRQGVSVVRNEIRRLSRGIGQSAFNAFKRQLRGRILIAANDAESVLLSACQSLLHFGHPLSTEETLEQVESITVGATNEAAAKYLDWERMNILVYR